MPSADPSDGTAAKLDTKIDAWLDARRDELVELAQALVRIPTENRPPSGDELAGQRFVAEQLASLGADVDIFTPDEIPRLRDHPAYFPTINGLVRDYQNRPDVVGTFAGRGSGRSVLFSTHIDTVPGGAPESWTHGSAFSGEVVDDRLYGRGSYDTKGALASHLMAIKCLHALDVELAGDVLVESVIDEEYGGSHGVLAARLRGHHADIAFNSEPTHLIVCPAHRGGREAFVRMRGDSGMAFDRERRVDPVLGLARVITAMHDFDTARNQLSPPPLYADIPGLPLYFNQLGGGGTTYPEAIGTPDEAYLHFWAEVYPGTTGDEFDSALMEAIAHELDAHQDTEGQRPALNSTTRFLPGSSMPLDHAALTVLRDVFSGIQDRSYELRGAPFACDAYIFNLYSTTPALILGPGGGGAHSPDEYVLVDDLIDLARICARFVWRWSGRW